MRTLLISIALLGFFSFQTEAKEVMRESPPREENKIIFINTLPKSGSVFIDTVLKSHTGYPGVAISLSRFHDDHVQKTLIETHFSQDCISQEHVDASSHNIEILEKYFSKMVLHLRDPRQELISWYHHVENTKQSHYSLWSDDICPPPEYFTWTREQKLNWQIENFLPRTIEWIQNWRYVLDSSSSMEILVTHFEDMVDNPQAWFAKIADFYNLSVEKWLIPGFSPGKLHQRKGQKDEWKNIFTEQQKRRVQEIIPQDLIEYFHWDDFET